MRFGAPRTMAASPGSRAAAQLLVAARRVQRQCYNQNQSSYMVRFEGLPSAAQAAGYREEQPFFTSEAGRVVCVREISYERADRGRYIVICVCVCVCVCVCSLLRACGAPRVISAIAKISIAPDPGPP